MTDEVELTEAELAAWREKQRQIMADPSIKEVMDLIRTTQPMELAAEIDGYMIAPLLWEAASNALHRIQGFAYTHQTLPTFNFMLGGYPIVPNLTELDGVAA